MASTQNKTTNKTTELLVYDKAKNHFLGQFPTDLPMEQAYIHIGVFLGWVLEKELYSSAFEDEAGHQILRFLNKDISCAILSAIWDGYLGEDLLNEDGNRFAKYYYQSGKYLEDYKSLLVEDTTNTIYHVKDSWENYEKMSNMIDKRFDEWKK